MWKLVLVSIGAARALKDGDVKCGGLEKKACKKVCDERGWCSRDVDYLGPLCKWDKNAEACMTVNALGEWADEEACVQLKKKPCKKAKGCTFMKNKKAKNTCIPFDQYVECKQLSQKKCKARSKCAWMAETSKCLPSDREKCYPFSACYPSGSATKPDPLACKESKKQCKADPACGWEEKVMVNVLKESDVLYKYQACAYKDPPKPFCSDEKGFCVAGTTTTYGSCTQAASFAEDGAWSFDVYDEGPPYFGKGLIGFVPCETDADCSTCTWDGSWTNSWDNKGACRCQTGHKVEEYQCGGEHAFLDSSC
jgi:hypothetical protein